MRPLLRACYRLPTPKRFMQWPYDEAHGSRLISNMDLGFQTVTCRACAAGMPCHTFMFRAAVTSDLRGVRGWLKMAPFLAAGYTRPVVGTVVIRLLNLTDHRRKQDEANLALRSTAITVSWMRKAITVFRTEVPTGIFAQSGVPLWRWVDSGTLTFGARPLVV